MNLSKNRSHCILPELNDICNRYEIMILGITGGIASGKSIVSGMLEKMGLPVIDFDIIARKVVKHGTPAWDDIISHFGKSVLTNTQEIDRKKMSGIVFNDADKRKKLEEITHPRIIKHFINSINEFAQNNPKSIIQAVIPLLFEVSLESLVHRILVVYIPREKQIERLMKRDGINRHEVIKILAAQLPIEDKIDNADFVINNENSPEETMKKAGILYMKLLDIHKDLVNPALPR